MINLDIWLFQQLLPKIVLMDVLISPLIRKNSKMVHMQKVLGVRQTLVKYPNRTGSYVLFYYVLPHLVALKCSSERREWAAKENRRSCTVATTRQGGHPFQLPSTMFSHSLSHSPIQKESPAFIMKDVCMYLYYLLCSMYNTGCSLFK